MVDERLSFPGSNERWLVFVNSGVVAALCDMHLSRAIGASQLADSMLDYLVKTEPAAMRYLLSRDKQPSAAEKREVIRQKIEHHKADFPRSRTVETQTLPAEEESPPTPTDAQDSLESANIAPHRARWREYRENHKPIAAKFVDVDGFGDRRTRSRGVASQSGGLYNRGWIGAKEERLRNTSWSVRTGGFTRRNARFGGEERQNARSVLSEPERGPVRGVRRRRTAKRFGESFHATE